MGLKMYSIEAAIVAILTLLFLILKAMLKTITKKIIQVAKTTRQVTSKSILSGIILGINEKDRKIHFARLYAQNEPYTLVS